VGETFLLEIGDGVTAVPIELIESTDLRPAANRTAPVEGRRVPFSIVFRGPSGVVLPQRIYGVEHAELGRFDPFLVTIGPDASGMRYEAVFT
jgi:hypothetical protein